MDKTLLIRAIAHGADALLTLNGMVLCKLTAGREVRMPVHEYILSGENRIQVLSLDSSEQAHAQSLASCDCTVNVWVELQKDRGMDLLVQPQVLFELGNSIRRGERIRKNRLLDVWVNLPVSFPRWRYLDLIHSRSDNSDLPALQSFLLNFLGLIQHRKMALLLPCFTVRNQEIAQAYNMDMQQVHSSFSAHLSNICNSATLADASLDPQSWRFHCVRQSAIYSILDGGYQPLLQFNLAVNDTTVHMPLHVGVLGGEVFVLR